MTQESKVSGDTFEPKEGMIERFGLEVSFTNKTSKLYNVT